MLHRVLPLRYGHLIRKVDHRGFVADFRRLPEKLTGSSKELKHVLKSSENALFCGSVNTGKLTLLKMAGRHLENKSQRVALVSAELSRANRLGGFLLNHFIGLRLANDDLPSQEQLESTFERYVRLVQCSYGDCIPSLGTIDVLVLDSLERISPAVFFAMEAVARRVRGNSTPFGGIRVIASANFWELAVHPTSDTGGYLFQSARWKELFPLQTLLLETHGQNPQLMKLSEKAQLGTLTEEDIEALESHRVSVKDKRFTPLITNFDAIAKKTVRFPRHRAIKILPDKYRGLRQTDIGSFLVNMLVQSSTPASFGLVDALSLEVGDQVHLLYDSNLSVGAGEVGEVTQLKEHFITVHFFERGVTLDVPRMRVVCHHEYYPEVAYEVRQFPLFPRKRLCPLTLRAHPSAYYAHINAQCLTDTNDLGCILSRMRDFSDFTMSRTASFAYLDNMVHEPTRIYYLQLLNRPISSAKEHWCRNCKSFVETESFYDHWASCVAAVRWCSECDKAIPLELLEPHREKHQVVLCLDCGEAVEWRAWDEHRLTCGMMMREVSPLNEFLPLRTKQLALELGLDKRDLHNIKTVAKSHLPKSRHLMQKYRAPELHR